MRRCTTALVVSLALVAVGCGGSDDTSPGSGAPPTTQSMGTTQTPPPTTTSTTTTIPPPLAPVSTASPAAFCQATAELNATLVLSAFSDLAGDGSQDLYLLAKLPQLTIIASAIAETAPSEYAAAAATLEGYYRNATELAAERGLALADLEALAADLEGDQLTIEELYNELGITPEDTAAVLVEAAASLGGREPPSVLLGAAPADLGCSEPELTVSACELLGPDELVPILGDEYTAEANDLPDIGQECTITGQASVYVVLAGPTYYLPSLWNEITKIDGLGDDAFLTSGLNSPFLYAKADDVVVSVSVFNTATPPSTEELVGLARIALDRAAG